MALGRYVSDLEVGDALTPVTYTMTPFIVREYCHGVDEFDEAFHRAVDPYGAQLVPPTLTHIDKIRLIKASCPDGPGPNARIHYQFHSKAYKPIPVGVELTASGTVARRYEKKGRTYLEMDIELRETATDELVMMYNDTAILNFQPAGS